MFKKNRQKQKHWQPQPFDETKLYKALSADELLSEPSYQKLLGKIRTASAVPQNDFETLYLPLIHNFAEFVQVIPWSTEEGLGGILARGLESGYKVLAAMKQEGNHYSGPLKYAVFSDALLHFIDTVLFDYRIMIHDEQGIFIERWQPLNGPMSAGTYYKIRPYIASTKTSGAIKALLARCVMPEKGFLYLTEDMRVFAIWIALLEEDREGAGGVAYLLQPILERFKEPPQLVKPVPVEGRETPKTQHGEAFWQWLKHGIQNGVITVNQPDSLVYRTKEGIFMIYPDVFEEYSRQYSRNVNAVVLCKQFNYLGLTPLSGYDYKFQQYFSAYPHRGEISYGQLGGKVPHTKTGYIAAQKLEHMRAEAERKSADHTFTATLRQRQTSAFQSNQASKGQLRQGVVITDPGLLFGVHQMPKVMPHLQAKPKPTA